MNQHSTDMQRVIASYSGVDARRRELAEFDSQSHLASLAAGLSQGLHGAVNGFDVQSVLRAGAPINGLRNIAYGDGREHWETALLTTLIDEHYDAARSLIAHGAAIDSPCWVIVPGQGGFGHTALHMTVAQENREATRILLDAGAAVNRQTTLGTTPLFMAAADDNRDLVELLLERGADPRIADFGGALPQEVAGARTRHLLG